MTIEPISHTDNILENVITLGKKNAKTLGLFPRDAFIDHAKKKHIIVAKNSEGLLGYILFRITASTGLINITHLCIENEVRNQGIAEKLLNALRDKYQFTKRGLVLNCREDYIEASKFWEKYGFKPAAEKKSKSKIERKLIRWFYDFGNADLFSNSSIQNSKICAVLDSNILLKLSDNSTNNEVSMLLADWLVDDVEYFYAPEIFNEIKRDLDQDRRNKTRAFLENFFSIKFNPLERDSILLSLDSIVLGVSNNDKSDKLQIAECIASNIPYFITLDEKLISFSEEIYSTFSVRIIRPIDYILYIDSLKNTTDYKAYRVAGAKYEYHKITTNDIEKLSTIFLAQGEKKHKLRELISQIGGKINNSQIKIVKDNSGSFIGFFALQIENNSLIVKAIRTTKCRISSILCNQLVYDIIQYSIEKQCNRITIDDFNISVETQEVLRMYNFSTDGNTYNKIVLNNIFSLSDLLKNDTIQTHFDINVISNKTQHYIEQARDMYLFQLERKLWPLKIIDIEIPIYIIPIKPYWAGQLFDYNISNNNLFGASPELSWSKENVYYRSVRPISEKTPARILWYVSTGDKYKVGREKGIVATSYLDEVEIGTAKKLYDKFKNYGIYNWLDIRGLAEKNPNEEIKVLKFSDTEIFDSIVPLETIRAIFDNNKQAKNTFASPVKVNKGIFFDIYKLGKRI